MASMIYTEKQFRPIPEYPVYPPYHKGEYLEDYFFTRFNKENPDISRNYIGISWTTLYCDNKRQGLQEYLNNLPRDKKYFTVSQHDDAPIENLPPDTICFSAGGNIRGNNITSIPLVCSKIPIELPNDIDKSILASFVGSATHPIRIKMIEACKENKNIIIYMKNWTPAVNQNEFDTFINLTAHSKFCLCPRGYGLNSFRLYEAMQLESIPVIITDNFYLPWQDELNWNEFSVLISEQELPNISNILLKYNDDEILKMRDKLKQLWKTHFSLDGMYNNIIKRLK